MFLDNFLRFLASPALTNLILFVTVFVAFIIGYRQIYISDVVELYATPSVKTVQNQEGNTTARMPIISIQNTGTRMVYIDKYVFNGSEYLTHGQVLPPTISNPNALYYIDLPAPPNPTTHVSVIVYYTDIDSRKWKTELLVDKTNNGDWKVMSLPRNPQ